MIELIPFWFISELTGDGPIASTITKIANGQSVKADKELVNIANRIMRLIEQAINEMERSRALATPSTAKDLSFQNLKDVVNSKFKQELYSIQKQVDEYQNNSAAALQAKNSRNLIDHALAAITATGAQIAKAVGGENSPIYQSWAKTEPGYWKYKAQQAEKKANQVQKQAEQAVNNAANKLSQQTQGIQGEEK